MSTVKPVFQHGLAPTTAVWPVMDIVSTVGHEALRVYVLWVLVANSFVAITDAVVRIEQRVEVSKMREGFVKRCENVVTKSYQIDHNSE